MRLATTRPEVSTNVSAQLPVRSQRSAASSAPTSTTPADRTATRVGYRLATVYRKISRTTSAASSTPTIHCASATAETKANEDSGQRRRQLSGTTSNALNNRYAGSCGSAALAWCTS